MQEAEFKAWLAERGANTESGRNTPAHAVPTIENNLAALGSSHVALAAAWTLVIGTRLMHEREELALTGIGAVR
ncbi:hypothetical protein GCM10019071_15060 [Sphingobium fuliginis]|uniref:Uncharacterized protein n=1 Tax=Sphingobium fuliginis (strain ATCC 27551) TaxID=336203 RepID=A0ABQ1EU32_SPHSA|nr:hypothetical protein GCM10019071_15060 [Sphingobium fuliginis]